MTDNEENTPEKEAQKSPKEMAAILAADSADQRWQAWKAHMRSKGMDTTREEFERIEAEYRGALTEDELFVAYAQWCASMGRDASRESFLGAVRSMYRPWRRPSDGKVVYPGVKLRSLFG